MSWKEVWPQTLQSPKNRINIEKNDNSLVASLKQIIVAVAWFPPHSGHQEASGPHPVLSPCLGSSHQARAGRGEALLCFPMAMPLPVKQSTEDGKSKD